MLQVLSVMYIIYVTSLICNVPIHITTFNCSAFTATVPKLPSVPGSSMQIFVKINYGN